MSKLRLLLETDDETNGLCLQWVPYIPGTMAQDVLVLTWNLPLGKQEVGLLLCLFKNVTGVGSQRSSQTHRGPQVDSEVLVAQYN